MQRRAAVEDHAVAFAGADVARQLLAAVTGLEAPYREVVWARFFEDLSPREIAQRTGAAVATVKSQLQRGIGKLRERLEEGGAEWRGALGAAFGLGLQPLAAAGAASGGAGVGGVIRGDRLSAFARAARDRSDLGVEAAVHERLSFRLARHCRDRGPLDLPFAQTKTFLVGNVRVVSHFLAVTHIRSGALIPSNPSPVVSNRRAASTSTSRASRTFGSAPTT